MNILNKIYFYSIIFISLIITTGAFIYKIYKLNNLGILFNFFLTVVLFVIILFLKKKYQKNENDFLNIPEYHSIDNYFKIKYKIKYKKLIWPSLYFTLFIICNIILFKNVTLEAIATPWEVVPNYFFALYATLTLFLVINISKNNKLNLVFLSLHFFLAFSTATVIYKLGFGFDPFIHNATLDYIKLHGEALPKPIYYLGYYPIVIALNKLTLIPIFLVNKFIVPILSAIFLPFIFYRLANTWFDNKKAIFLSILFLLILPFNIFTISTPQNLAFLFLILTVITSVMATSFFDFTVLTLLSLATFFIHPISGIPAIFLTISTLLFQAPSIKIKKYFFIFILLSNTLALPLAFYFLNFQNGNTNISSYENSITINGLRSFFNLNTAGDENIILNFIYLVIFNYKFILILLILFGIFLTIKYKKECSRLFIHISFAISLFISFFLTNILPFDFLISYERENYSLRILINAIIFLLPLIFIVLHGIFLKILRETRLTKLIIIIFLIFLLSTSLYMSYPRKDKYYNDHSFSVSESDIKSVNWIEKNTDKEYIVLANQQVSAAALNQFGFKKYFKSSENSTEQIFFYPIPTGGKLYQLYLDMVYKSPNKETMEKAMDLAQVNEAYFVLNSYWWAFPKILNEAKIEADEYEKINNGKNYIFKYIR